MKSFKKLIPAVVLLLVSAMLMATASYAWFSMNTRVTATGMQVKAKAEGGLLISATHAADSWSNTAAITLAKDVQLLPASTSDGAAWYHAHSKTSSTAISFANGDGYYLLGTADDAAPTGSTTDTAGKLKVAEENLFTTGSSKVVYDENGTDSVYTVGSDDGFYLVTEYYIRSSGDAISIGDAQKYKALAINQINITTINGSANLDQCLRLGVVIYNGSTVASDFVVLAPINGADGVSASNGTKSQTTAATTDTTALVGLCSATVNNYFANANTNLTAAIPANTSNEYLTARVFVWFEGEDQTCISDNLTTSLDALSIEVSFKLVEVAGQYNDTATTAEPTV